MKSSLVYGQKKLDLEVPEHAHLLNMKETPPVPDSEEAVRQALENPIHSKPLRELAKGRHSACIVISDITRPVPNHLLLPPMLETLEESGIARQNITILIATGMHRPNQGEELAGMVGKSIQENYTIINHFCQQQDDVRCIDNIEDYPIEINRHYLDADLKILTGLIEPHFYAGYSGGRKSILPGISSFETMKFMHSYKVIDHPRVANCVLEGNIFHDYGIRITEKAGADYIVNVCINRDRQISGIFAGHYNEAHMAGCDFVYNHAVVELDRPMDLVITSGGGYPLDATFYQISKSLTCAKDILKKGGTIVVACECREGLGSDDFCSIIRSVSDPECFFRDYSDPDNFVIDQWCAQNIYQAIDHAGSVYVYSSGLSVQDVEKMGAHKIDNLQQAVDLLLPDCPNVAVAPEGPYVVGMLV
ncbi:MAG: nickel-dependent lactate racemase [Thermodesulfobacteriota bacterium]